MMTDVTDVLRRGSTETAKQKYWPYFLSRYRHNEGDTIGLNSWNEYVTKQD